MPMPIPNRLAFIALLTAASFLSAQNAQPGAAIATQSWKISGVVVHSISHQPLPGIEVSIASTEQRDLTVQAVTGKDGSFVFENVASGKYSLVAQGHGFAVQAYQQHGPYSTAVAVGPQLNSENLIFHLVPDGSISGSVLDDENEPVRTGQVFLFRRNNAKGTPELQGETTLDEQGRYHFAHLHPGSYLVAVSAQPWYAQDPQVIAKQPSVATDDAAPADASVAGDRQPDFAAAPSTALDVVYPVTYYPGVTEPGNAAPIVLAAGERVSAEVTVRATAALHLMIRNASSDPARPTSPVVMQRLFEDADTPPIPLQARVQPLGSGVINIGGLAPGHLLLSLRTFNGKEWVSDDREMDVVADTEVEASETATSPVTIEGILQSPAGSPFAPGAAIGFRNRKTGESFSSEISPKGTFQLQQSLVGPTTFQVSVFNAGDLTVREITARGATVAGHSVRLPRTGIVQLNIALSKGLARIDGAVLDKDRPVSEAMVLLIPESPAKNDDFFRRDQSDSDGTFSLYQVVPGRYTLVAIQNGWDLDWRDPSVLQPYLEHGRQVEITTPHTYKVSVSPQVCNTSPLNSSQP